MFIILSLLQVFHENRLFISPTHITDEKTEDLRGFSNLLQVQANQIGKGC